MKQYDRIIFVAQSGNCREPMAAGILEEYPLYHPVQVLARGLVVQFPEPMNQKAEAVMRGNNIQTEGFTSQQLKKEDITPDTLILAMESVYRNRVQERFPELDEEHLDVLSHFVGEELETLDPYGGQLPNYGLCYESLRGSIRKLVRILNGEAQPVHIIEQSAGE